MEGNNPPMDLPISINTIAKLTGRSISNIQRDLKNILKSPFLSNQFKQNFNTEFLNKVSFEYYLMSLNGNGIERNKEAWLEYRSISKLMPITINSTKHIYIITNSLNHTKCGVTNDMNVRLKAFKTGNSEGIIVQYLSEKLGNAFDIEKMVHNKFYTHRLKGEWFSIHHEVMTDFLKESIDEHGIVHE